MFDSIKNSCVFAVLNVGFENLYNSDVEVGTHKTPENEICMAHSFCAHQFNYCNILGYVMNFDYWYNWYYIKWKTSVVMNLPNIKSHLSGIIGTISINDPFIRTHKLSMANLLSYNTTCERKIEMKKGAHHSIEDSECQIDMDRNQDI